MGRNIDLVKAAASSGNSSVDTFILPSKKPDEFSINFTSSKNETPRSASHRTDTPRIDTLKADTPRIDTLKADSTFSTLADAVMVDTSQNNTNQLTNAIVKSPIKDEAKPADFTKAEFHSPTGKG